MRELTRVATRENEREWIDAVRGENLRQIEERVSCRRKGDGPEASPDPSLALRTISFKVRPATHALMRHVTTALADQVGRFVEDDEIIEAVANAFLGNARGAEDQGRATRPDYAFVTLKADVKLALVTMASRNRSPPPWSRSPPARHLRT